MSLSSTLAMPEMAPVCIGVTKGDGGSITGIVNFQYLRDAVDDHPKRLLPELHHDDAASLGVLGLAHAEALPEVENRNDAAAEVDDPFDEFWSSRDFDDLRDADDLPHLEDVDAVMLLAQPKDDALFAQNR